MNRSFAKKKDNREKEIADPPEKDCAGNVDPSFESYRMTLLCSLLAMSHVAVSRFEKKYSNKKRKLNSKKK